MSPHAPVPAISIDTNANNSYLPNFHGTMNFEFYLHYIILFDNESLLRDSEFKTKMLITSFETQIDSTSCRYNWSEATIVSLAERPRDHVIVSDFTVIITYFIVENGNMQLLLLRPTPYCHSLNVILAVKNLMVL